MSEENNCTTIGDWLREHNIADVESSIEIFRKTVEQYYPDKINVRDTISILGIPIT